MNTSRFFSLACLAVGTAATSLLTVPASAQTSVSTDPVGYTQLSCLANSDTRLSIPFTRPAEFTGLISSITQANNTATITVASTPGWTANQFQYVATTQPKTYYAIVGPNNNTLAGTVSVTNNSKTVTGTGTTFTNLAKGDVINVNGYVGVVDSVASATSLTLVSNFIGATATGASATFNRSPKEGSYYTVTSNGTNTLTVALNGDSLAAVASAVGNTTVTLIPYWTLGTAFPASDAGVSYAASPNPNPRNRATQILLPDLVSSGVDLVPSTGYYNYDGKWRLAGGDPAASYDDTIFLPTTFFLLRNTSTATKFTPAGSVYMNRLSNPLYTQASSGQQDNAVALPRPADVTLNDLGLISSGAFQVTLNPAPRSRLDALITYDNTLPGVDKTPSASYYYYNNGWRKAGEDPNTDFGTIPISYGSGFLIRKVSTTNGTTSFWQNTRNY